LVPKLSRSRSDCGLPETGFVFCCFNNLYKITPSVFDIWIRLLSDVPGSVLWLLADHTAAMNALRAEAKKRGVAAHRLVFAAREPYLEHLGRLRNADLFLDTLPYNAHTTCSDALWVGVPVLTEIGDTFPGRVAASILFAAGTPELVTQSSAEYEAAARHLATNPIELSRIRSKLEDSRRKSPLFDMAKYTRNLENLLAALIRNED
jgi:predicted O-linked N-acetylglucosamine transferase (SPINDLY family)